MKHLLLRLAWLLLIFATTGLITFSQEKGRVFNIQAEQRTDGSDTIDVYYDLTGYESSYNIQAYFHYGVGFEIDEQYCEGDFGPGVVPGNNKHFTYYMAGQKPGVEWEKIKIEIRAYFTTGEPCAGLPSVDYYGQTYETIKIGGQCWLKQNLNAGVMIEYEFLPWLDDEIEKYCYNNDPANCATYGALYHWWEAMDYGQAIPGKKGICPAGFHIPTKEEFEVLIELFGGNASAGGHLKATTNWNAPNTGATNTSFFTAFGAGSGHNTAGIGGGDQCYGLGELTYIFTSTQNAPPDKPALGLYFNHSQANFTNLAANPYPFGSVRCMKDCSSQPSASNAGPDQIAIAGNYTTLAATLPAVGIGKWVIASSHSGNKAGTLVDKWDPASGFYGYPGETYLLEWQISNECTVSKDQVSIEFEPFTCGDDFVDMRNGEVYPTAMIGDYCWMTKNMNIGEMTDVGDYDANGGMEKSCYNDDPANCDIYGGLYKWTEAVQQYYNEEYSRGICPLGWFIPTDDDWCNLTFSIDGTVDCNVTNEYTGTDAGGKMKESGTAHWMSPNTGANNASGFSALGAGFASDHYTEEGFWEFNESASFWSPTIGSTQTKVVWHLNFDEQRVGRKYVSSYYREYSVRCVHYPNY